MENKATNFPSSEESLQASPPANGWGSIRQSLKSASVSFIET